MPEVPDDAADPKPPQLPPSLLAKLKGQSAQPETPIYRVGRDGTGRLETPTEATTPARDAGDLTVLVMAVQQMADDLCKAVDAVPDATKDGKLTAEAFDLSTRLAIVHAGNAIDYAVRRVQDIGRERRIMKLRRELAHEMKAAGLEGDPRDGATPTG